MTRKCTKNLFFCLLMGASPAIFASIRFNPPEPPDLDEIGPELPFNKEAAICQSHTNCKPEEMLGWIRRYIKEAELSINFALKNGDLQTVHKLLEVRIKSTKLYQKCARETGNLVPWAKALDYLDRCKNALLKYEAQKASSGISVKPSQQPRKKHKRY